MRKQIVLTEGITNGFDEAIEKLRSLSDYQLITPWHTYTIISRDEYRILERYSVILYGIGVVPGTGEAVHNVHIDVIYDDEKTETPREVKIVIFH